MSEKSKLKSIRIIKKPWGEEEEISLNKKTTVKLLKISPKKKLSLQIHKKRDEFWQVIAGECEIIIGNKKTQAKNGDRFFIPRNTVHRIIGGNKASEILEVSFGKWLVNDIERLEDSFGRKGKKGR